MLLDERSEFADAVEITLGAGTNLIGDVMDVGGGEDIGQGRPVYLVVQVTTAFAGGTAVQFVLASDAQATITTDGTESRHYLSDIYLDAELIVGFEIAIALPMGSISGSATSYERYLGILGVGTGTHTAGSINAFLALDPHGTRAYPDGNN